MDLGSFYNTAKAEIDSVVFDEFIQQFDKVVVSKVVDDRTTSLNSAALSILKNCGKDGVGLSNDAEFLVALVQFYNDERSPERVWTFEFV